MDGRGRAEGLTALEGEIEAALAVDPSPEFVAKVRARVANEPPPASWWHLRWPVMVGAAAGAVVVMAVAVSWQPAAPAQITVRVGTDVVLTMPTREPAGPQVGADQTIESHPARAVPRSAGRTVSGPAVARDLPGPRSPEVLISRDEQLGLELLLAAVSDGRLTPALASQLVAADATGEATEIALSDIVIQPLQQFAALEGEGQ